MPEEDLLTNEQKTYLKILKRLEFFESISLKITEKTLSQNCSTR